MPRGHSFAHFSLFGCLLAASVCLPVCAPASNKCVCELSLKWDKQHLKSTPTLWQLSEDLDRLLRRLSKQGREEYESSPPGLRRRDPCCFSQRWASTGRQVDPRYRDFRWEADKTEQRAAWEIRKELNVLFWQGAGLVLSFPSAAAAPGQWRVKLPDQSSQRDADSISLFVFFLQHQIKRGVISEHSGQKARSWRQHNPVSLF